MYLNGIKHGTKTASAVQIMQWDYDIITEIKNSQSLSILLLHTDAYWILTTYAEWTFLDYLKLAGKSSIIYLRYFLEIG